MAHLKNKKVALDRETLLIVLVVCGGTFGTLFGVILTDTPTPGQRTQSQPTALSMANIPLATGEEPIDKLFTQSGCPVCHTIPGIHGAKGRQGPKLILAKTASQRLADPNYTGNASTEWEYIIESILSPGTYVVPGYPDRVMPQWYGRKLSAAALEKIAQYLQQVTDSS